MARALTEEQRIQIAARFVAGESIPSIARRFERHPNTIRRALQKAGVSETDRADVGSSSPTASSPPEVLEAYRDLGAPPPDPLERLSWIHAALGVSAAHTLTDAAYDGNEPARRKELREIATAMAKVVPIDLLADVKKMIAADRAELERGKGPEMEAAHAESKPRRARRKTPAREG